MPMTKAECIQYVKAHMETKYAVENGAYTANKKHTGEGCVNHSVGCAQPSVDVFFKHMNLASCGWGVNALIGDFHKGEGRILLVLKPETRPWGCGAGSKGSWNNSRVQWEICEPAGHTYAGGTMIGYDVAKNQEYFDRMWKLVVAWNVYMADYFGYDPDKIADHSESYKAGYGSNHSDVMQWWPKHGKSMQALRDEVKAILEADTPSPVPPAPQPPTPEMYRIRKSWDDAKSQLGAFTVLQNAKNMCDRVTGYYVFDSKGNVVYPENKPEPFKAYLVQIKVADLCIRKGPGTDYKFTGSYTGKGVFTIVEESKGQGSDTGWGKLKSGAGWISLDFCTKL